MCLQLLLLVLNNLYCLETKRKALYVKYNYTANNLFLFLTLRLVMSYIYIWSS